MNEVILAAAELQLVCESQHVLLLRSSKGVGLDIALAGLPFEALMIKRATYCKYPTFTIDRKYEAARTRKTHGHSKKPPRAQCSRGLLYLKFEI